jgi:isohexenylglutaconyl-CoA hydratase
VANRLALTAAVLTGREAHRIGLVHEVAETDDALTEKIAAVVTAIKASAPGALAATKALVRRAAWERPDSLIGDAAALFAAAARGAEAQEGMAAFLQKRTPSWAAG